MVGTDLRDTNGWISSHDPLTVIPLTDSVIDQLGHDVRSSYVETYWLPILGPSAIWAARRLAEWLESSPGRGGSPARTAGSLARAGGRHRPACPDRAHAGAPGRLRPGLDRGQHLWHQDDLPAAAGSTHHPAAPVPGPQPSARARGEPMNDHEIEEGRDGWGSHLAPPEPPCECVVQPTVQSEPVCTSDCTAHCTGDCTTRPDHPRRCPRRIGYEHDRCGTCVDQPDHGPHRARHGGPGAHLLRSSVSPRPTSSPPRSLAGSSSRRRLPAKRSSRSSTPDR